MGESKLSAPIHGVRMDTTCAVHRHRELVPIERHHIHPLGEGGPDVEANKVTVCANGHMSIHAYLTLLLKAQKRQVERLKPSDIPWLTRRQYGRGVRKYAQQGYDAIQAAR
jgi:rhodanese-related sulfurtransferase